MPIYAYKCGSCGHAKDVLQKISDDPLTDCPACGKPSFSKQLTAAGFQLKGSGWYATDFKGGSSGTTAAPASDGASTATDSGGGGGDTATATASAAPAACGTSCACH
jgi:putative FmdB family regulatory protein